MEPSTAASADTTPPADSRKASNVSFRASPRREEAEAIRAAPPAEEEEEKEEPAPFSPVSPKSPVSPVSRKYSSPSEGSTRNFLLVYGAIVMCLIVSMPIWDAARLLNDPVFVWFMSRRLPLLIIMCCLFALAVWEIAVLVFFKFAKSRYKTEQTVLMICMLVTAGLGLSLLVLSEPLKLDSMSAHEELFFNCEHGAQTHLLWQHASYLHQLRQQPSCANKLSVEYCDGFQAQQPYTAFLKQLESKYQCAGFCINSTINDQIGAAQQQTVASFPSAKATVPFALLSATGGDSTVKVPIARVQAAEATEAEVPVSTSLRRPARQDDLQKKLRERLGSASTDDVALLQQQPVDSHPLRSPRRGSRQGRLAAGAAASPRLWVPSVKTKETGRAQAYRPGEIGTYPSALFSSASRGVTCEGMAGRTFKYNVGDVARLLYVEGLGLLISSVVAGLMKTLSLCMEGRKGAGFYKRALKTQL